MRDVQQGSDNKWKHWQVPLCLYCVANWALTVKDKGFSNGFYRMSRSYLQARSVCLTPCNLSCFLSVPLLCYNTRIVVSARQMRNWIWLQGCLIKKESRKDYVSAVGRHVKRHRAHMAQLPGENRFLNQSLYPFIYQGFSMLLLSFQLGWRSSRLLLLHIICHQSHNLHTISTQVFHPLFLSSHINLSGLLSLTAAIHSVKQPLLHLHDKAECTHTHTQVMRMHLWLLGLLLGQ